VNVRNINTSISIPFSSKYVLAIVFDPKTSMVTAAADEGHVAEVHQQKRTRTWGRMPSSGM
jgi:hypothetical protein